MYMTKYQMNELRAEARKHIDEAKRLVSEHGDDSSKWPDAAKTAYTEAIAKGRTYMEQVNAGKADEDVIDAAKDLLGDVEYGPGQKAAKSRKDNGQRLNIKAIARTVVEEFDKRAKAGQKALAPGAGVVVGTEFQPNPIALGKIATTFLDLLPITQRDRNYDYLRQKTRTNNAAKVAEGAVKPTSVYELERIENSLEVVAHLSEPIPKYWMVDNGSLEDFIANEMEYGLLWEIESLVLADINATSGIQLQAFSTNILETLRKTLTKLQAVGLTPAGIVLHPNDWESVELQLSTTSAVEYGGLPYDAANRRLWGVPVATAMSQAAGVSHTIAEESVGVDTDGSVDLDWSETNADDFTKNLIRARCETRTGTTVWRPLGVIRGDLTA